MDEPEAENADPACDPFSAFGPLNVTGLNPVLIALRRALCGMKSRNDTYRSSPDKMGIQRLPQINGVPDEVDSRASQTAAPWS
jgi:hypothetical protein